MTESKPFKISIITICSVNDKYCHLLITFFPLVISNMIIGGRTIFHSVWQRPTKKSEFAHRILNTSPYFYFVPDLSHKT